jgi:hypothetical protein
VPPCLQPGSSRAAAQEGWAARCLPTQGTGSGNHPTRTCHSSPGGHKRMAGLLCMAGLLHMLERELCHQQSWFELV